MANPTPVEIDAAIPADGIPNRALTNAALKSMAAAIDEASGGVSDADPRLSDSRPPMGGAGGVLSGSYPNPGFAVDMATQAELDTGLASKVSTSLVGANGGVAPLDASGLVPVQHLNVSGLEFKGAWNAATNTPALLDGSGTVGAFYKTSVAGTQNFGNGSYTFAVGDWVIYAGGTWQRIGVHESVMSVNGKTGAVNLTAADVGALPSNYTPPSATWASISGKPDLALKPRGTISAAIPAVYGFRSSAQSIPNTTVTDISWTSFSYDPFSMLQGGVFVVPSWATHARVTACADMATNATGYRYAVVKRGTSNIAANRALAIPSTTTTVVIVSQIFTVSPGDPITLAVWQDTGAALAFQPSSSIQIELYTAN